jgi:hypothetical protein
MKIIIRGNKYDRLYIVSTYTLPAVSSAAWACLLAQTGLWPSVEPLCRPSVSANARGSALVLRGHAPMLRASHLSLKARSSPTVWLNKDRPWFAAASGKRGRSPKFSDAAMQFCLTIENLFGLALRQAMGFAACLLNLSELDWPAPHFGAVCRRQRSLQVHVPFRSSQAGLHLLVDATGIKFFGRRRVGM